MTRTRILAGLFIAALTLIVCGRAPLTTGGDLSGDGGGTGPAARPDAGPAPTVPTGLTPTAGDGKVTLEWSASSEGDVRGYQVYSGPSPVELLPVAGGFVDHPASLFAVAGLTNGTPYFFALCAEDLGGLRSERTAPVTATPRPEDQTAPSIIRVDPPNTSTGVATTATIVITFSEPMKPAAVSLSAEPPVAFRSPNFSGDGTVARIAPVATLRPSTQFTVAVSGRDSSDNALTGGRTFTFTTAGPPDTAPPALLWSAPASGSTRIAPEGLRLVLAFSEEMDTNTVTASVNADTFEPGPPSWSAENTRATFAAPVSTWAAGATYTVKVTGQDLAANAMPAATFSFGTANPPAAATPTVTGASPNGAGAPTNAAISVGFSAAMDRPATEAAFSTTPAVAGAFRWDTGGRWLSFRPSAELAAATLYRVSLGARAAAPEGNTLAAPYQFAFTTAAGRDVTAPTVVGSTPSTGAVGLSRLPVVGLRFSEPMDRASVQAAFRLTSPTDAVGAFAWNVAGDAVSFALTSALPYDTTVRWELQGTAADLAGNPLQGAATGSFRIVRQGHAELPVVSSLTGYLFNTGASWVAGGLYVGDLADDSALCSFVTFSLSELPPSLTTITAATLYATQTSIVGTPIGAGPASLGFVIAEHVLYGDALDAADFERSRQPSAPDVGSLSTTTGAGRRALDVSEWVREDWAWRASRSLRTQFRWRTSARTTDLDRGADYVTFGRTPGVPGDPYLDVRYEYP